MVVFYFQNYHIILKPYNFGFQCHFLVWLKNYLSNEFFKLQLVTSKEVKKKEKAELPPVSVMVIESIKALKEPPRKGSTLRAIKETISLNWPVKK